MCHRFIVGEPDNLINLHIAARKMQDTHGSVLRRKPVFAINLRPPGSDRRNDVLLPLMLLFWLGRDGALAPNNRKIAGVYPDAASKIQLARCCIDGHSIENVEMACCPDVAGR
jgi:hypothetical protein